MLIWLGKQILGQRDRVEEQQTVKATVGGVVRLPQPFADQTEWAKAVKRDQAAQAEREDSTSKQS